jgi:sarcosine oxidase, subunit delta
MMQIHCPHCGLREESEFAYGGDANPLRPSVPAEDVSDEAWALFLYYYSVTKGPKPERWFHAYGCRHWFQIDRNTVTHEIRARL